MTRKTLALTSLLVAIAMLVAAWLVGSALPADVPLPTHWGLDGEPDQFSDKWTALLMPAGLVGGISLLLYFLPALEPRRQGLARSQGLYLWSWAALLVLGAMIQLAVISIALRWSVHGTSFILGGVGLVLALIGNQLGKSRSMYLIGIRTPWTLASEEVWIKTHRLAGKLMVGGGLLMIVAAFLPLPSGLVATLIIGVLVGAVAVPVAYSYLLWRAELRRNQASG
jgi:uncharacterized membrane protein